MTRLQATTLLTLLAAPVRVACAQTPVTFAVSVRTRIEAWQWFEATAGNNSYVYSGTLARIAAGQQRSWIGWRVELAAPLLVGLPDDAQVPAPAGQLGLGASYFGASDSSENAASVFLKQAFLRVGAAGNRGHALRLGRFEFIDGLETTPAHATLAALRRERIAHRLLGNFSFSHVQRSFDGAHYTLDRPKLNITAAGMRPTRGVFDVNGWEPLDIGVLYGSLSGPMGSERKPADWRIFALLYHDYRDPVPAKADNRADAVRVADRADVTVTTAGAHYLRVLPTGSGPLDLVFWGAVQGGAWGSQDHAAHAFALELGFQPTAFAALRPWLRFGWNRASGDDDPADDRHGTFFQVLPTPRVYARFPFFNLMNINDVFASLIVRTSRATVRADVHRLDLSESADRWYSGGGGFEPETFGYAARPSGDRRHLAKLIDVSAEARLSRRVSVQGYAAVARGGDVITNIYRRGRNSRLAYLELEYRR